MVQDKTDSSEAWLEGITHEGLREALRAIRARDPEQAEFHQAVKEVAASLQPLFDRQPNLLPVFVQLAEPERQVIFRVPWLDDHNNLVVNRGMRVQVSSALGPYKGGLRFHPSVSLSVVKFLGFEQCFKNALTGLPMGGGKGGADFDPKGRSDGEIQRFCQSFMCELYRHIGHQTDVPAGDIGVGTREIGFLFGHFKRLTTNFSGVLTGKGLGWGGSPFRPEATGYGAVFMAEEVLKSQGEGIQGKRCLVSGAGNVASHCASKLVEEGAVVLTLSDSRGCVYAPDGLTKDDIAEVMRVKSKHAGRLEECQLEGAEYRGDGAKPWRVADSGVDLAFPCATQNELGEEDAQHLAKAGVKLVLEGANMPCTPEAVAALHAAGVTFVPGKMGNAGGVAVSGLELVQNRSGMVWSREEVCAKLHAIMRQIFRDATAAAGEYHTDLASGANISAFLKLADAMVAQGAV